jgi:4-diphosphocytidyl-2-C-methyl-D-erythritol kinase
MKLRALAPGKVNLCLYLGPVRADGLHRVVTLVESVSLADELVVSDEGDADVVSCPGVDGANLVDAALAGLRAIGWDAPPVRIDVLKRVPVAAGMGGGSADAAAALRLAMELAPGRPEEVVSLAASLGADVPSQLAPGLVLGTGGGEVVEPFEPLRPHAIVVLPLPYALATADVYREADRLGLPRDEQDLSSRYDELVAALRPEGRLPAGVVLNDLEPAAVSLCPAIADGLDSVRAHAADHAIVCGSGPTVAGLYWGADALARAREVAEKLAARYPQASAVVPVGSGFGSPSVL